MPTYEVQAPNGKTLSIEGDHVPSEAELQSIFKAAGVATGTTQSAPSGPTSTIQKIMDIDQSLRNIPTDVGIGLMKKAARVGQIIPGVSGFTDKLYGMEPGSSEKMMQPANAAETAGGLLGDAALLAATGAADIPGAPNVPGMKVIPKTVAQGIQTAAKPVVQTVDTFSHAAMKGAVEALVGKGPITPEKVTEVVAKYGRGAAKFALGVVGGKAIWEAWDALKK